MPIFDIIGKSVTHCGNVGSGHAMKILNNFINANSLLSLIEALSIGKNMSGNRVNDGGNEVLCF